jgi:uncharacterized protein
MKNTLLNTVAIIFATGLVLAGVLAVLDTPRDDQLRTVSVQGEALRTVTADEAEIRFSVVTEASTAEEAARLNAQRMSAVVENLRGFGEVETQGYSIQPVYDYWNTRDERDLRIQFYRAQNTVVLKMTDFERVGDAIDSATQNGANSVSSLNFQLSDAARDRLRTELLAEAGQNAKARANSIAQGLDLRLGAVHTVSEGQVYFPGPMYARAEMMDAAGSAPTPIEPGSVDVRASVSVTYRLR